MGFKEELERLQQQLKAANSQRDREDAQRRSDEATLREKRRLQNLQDEQARKQLESRMQAMDSQIGLRHQMNQAKDFLNKNTNKKWKLMDIDATGEVTELTGDEYGSSYVAARYRVKGTVVYAIAKNPNDYGNEVDYVFVGRTKYDNSSFDQSDIGSYEICYGDAPIYTGALDKRIADVVVNGNLREGRIKGGSTANLSSSATPDDLGRYLLPAVRASI